MIPSKKSILSTRKVYQWPIDNWQQCTWWALERAQVSKLQKVLSWVLDVGFSYGFDHSNWIWKLNTLYVFKILYDHLFTIYETKIMLYKRKSTWKWQNTVFFEKHSFYKN